MLAAAMLSIALTAPTLALEQRATVPAPDVPGPRTQLSEPTSTRRALRRGERPGLAYLGGLGGAVLGTGAGLLAATPIAWVDGPPEAMVLVPIGTLAGASLGVHLLSDSAYGWELLGASLGMASLMINSGQRG